MSILFNLIIGLIIGAGIAFYYWYIKLNKVMKDIPEEFKKEVKQNEYERKQKARELFSRGEQTTPRGADSIEDKGTVKSTKGVPILCDKQSSSIGRMLKEYWSRVKPNS